MSARLVNVSLQHGVCRPGSTLQLPETSVAERSRSANVSGSCSVDPDRHTPSREAFPSRSLRPESPASVHLRFEAPGLTARADPKVHGAVSLWDEARSCTL